MSRAELWGEFQRWSCLAQSARAAGNDEAAEDAIANARHYLGLWLDG